MNVHSEAQKIGCLITVLPGYRLLGGNDILKQGDLWFNFVEMKFEPVYDQFFGLLCENYIAIRTLTVIEEKELPQELRDEFDKLGCPHCGGSNTEILNEFDETDKINKPYLKCYDCGNAELSDEFYEAIE